MNRGNQILLALTTLLSAAAVFAYDTPDKTVTEFIHRDSRGERLGSKVSEMIDKLQIDNHFEPAWDTSVAITGYLIKSIRMDGEATIASVLFMNSWTTSDDFDMKDVKDEEVEIHLKKTKDCWKISPPFTMPRIFPEVLLKHLEKVVEEDKTTDVGKGFLIDDQKRLDALRQYLSFIERRKGKEQ